MNPTQIRNYLVEHDLDGWMLYEFRGNNPVALHVAGLADGGTRRWFLWIPAHGEPIWLIHADQLEVTTLPAQTELTPLLA